MFFFLMLGFIVYSVLCVYAFFYSVLCLFLVSVHTCFCMCCTSYVFNKHKPYVNSLHVSVRLEVNITTFLCYLAVWQNIYRCKSFLRIELNVFVINREFANNICLLIFFVWDFKKIIICQRESYVV